MGGCVTIFQFTTNISRPGLFKMKPTTGFIGGGNMAGSLIGGMLEAGFDAETILLAEPSVERCQVLEAEYGVRTTQNNTDVLVCDTVILAVKPQVMQEVCTQLKPCFSDHSPLFISIAAGLLSETINSWLGTNRAIVRCMPNTPSLLGCGATALFANAAVSAEQKKLAEMILQAVGITVWVNDEEQINAVTAVSGSGPAYFFLMMEAMQEAGINLGLDNETALKLVIQTALGAARMANERNQAPSTLREQVTSKGGTTEQAIKYFEENGFRKLVMQALQAANDRSVTLSRELGQT